MTTGPPVLLQALTGRVAGVSDGNTLRAISNNLRGVDLCCTFCRPTTWDSITNDISKMDVSLFSKTKDPDRRYLRCNRCGENFDDLCVNHFLKFFSEKNITIPWIEKAELFLLSGEKIGLIDGSISPCCEHRSKTIAMNAKKVKYYKSKQNQQHSLCQFSEKINKLMLIQ